MCTLVAAVGQFADWPLIVAANRDELLSRAASPPRIWDGAVPFLAPRDEVAGGSWLGLNARGVFVGVTNRFGVPRDDRRQSRGTLVTTALRHPSAQAIHLALKDLAPDAYNAFHLFYADRVSAHVTWCDGERVHQQTLGPGLHIITERSLGGDDRARTELVRQGFRAVAASLSPTVESLAALMRQHQPENPVGSPCVHLPELGYGTRSSLLLLLGKSWGPTRVLWAEGPPCQNAYVEQNHLLSALLADGL